MHHNGLFFINNIAEKK